MGLKAATENSAMLTCWKDIARYMGKGVRTVQRWEQDFGLPVRRPAGSPRKAVIARIQDLDAWVALRCSTRDHLQPKSGCEERSLPILSALSAQLRTSRELHESNQAVLRDVHAAVRSLRDKIDLSIRLSRGTVRLPQEPAAPADPTPEK